MRQEVVDRHPGARDLAGTNLPVEVDTAEVDTVVAEIEGAMEGSLNRTMTKEAGEEILRRGAVPAEEIRGIVMTGKK